ncbi:MAG: RluA family pseudouridine synthase [Bacillota bacterium]|nr:RluA family pseudouridine synthase [Bacillota bacterium]
MSQHETPWPQEADILYLDNHLLAVLKPAGMPSQPGGQAKADATSLLRDWVKERFQKPGRVWLNPVHRLDQPVAGILLFARTSKAAGRLSAALRERRVERGYLAVVARTPGAPTLRVGDTVLWTDVLEREADGRSVGVSAGAEGQEASLSVRLLARDTGTGRCLLEIALGSGRRHQIRAQLAARGYPILGDRRYAPPSVSGLGPAPALYAWRLALEHPTGRGPLEITSRPPLTGVWQDFAKSIMELIPLEGDVK